DQVDWDTALRENNGRVNPLGLYDLDRNIRPVGEAYKQLIKDWRQVLPTQSVCLNVPIAVPEGFEIGEGDKELPEDEAQNKTSAHELFKADKQSK
ncbi:MAG: hypothetical protein ABIR81_00240, partial [Ginsengibacter sp.]